MVDSQFCKNCGSTAITFLGTEDGCGAYGDAMCDIWRCEDCGFEYESGCIAPDDPQFDGADDHEDDFSRWNVDHERYGD